MAGYSGTPLPKKLGIKEGHRVLLESAPESFEGLLKPLPEGVIVARDAKVGQRFDVMLLFADSQRNLVGSFPALQARMKVDSGLWVCWPKKSSGVATDLSDGFVREFGLSTGLVDNKVAAIDGTWSGLRFVVRVVDR